MQIPFIGGGYSGRSLNINSQICQNLYPVMDQQGGKAIALMNTPGLSLFAQPTLKYIALLEKTMDPTRGPEVRGLHVMGSYLYAVIGNWVYMINSGGGEIALTVPTGQLLTGSGKVWMANNGTQILITDGSYGYIVSGSTPNSAVTQITDTDFPTPSSCAFQDGYFIVTSKDTGRFYISTSYDGTSWDALDYATAEGDPDNLQCVVSVRRELWLLGKTTYEVWYNSGDATFPFDRVPGAVNRVGCAAPGSAADYQGVLCWLDNSRAVVSSNGYDSQRISTPQIDYQLSRYGIVSDALGWMYSQEGHTFYILTFPTEKKVWGYDFTTQAWHTRASENEDTRSRANCYAFFEGMHIIGDYENGNLYKYDLSQYTENGAMMRRIRSCPAVHADRKTLIHKSFEIEFEAGVGLITDDTGMTVGTDPQAMLDWSNDGGHTWSNEHWTDIGHLGNYKTRAVWRRLGSSRDRVYRVTIADPVKTVIIGANLEAEACNS